MPGSKGLPGAAMIIFQNLHFFCGKFLSFKEFRNSGFRIIVVPRKGRLWKRRLQLHHGLPNFLQDDKHKEHNTSKKEGDNAGI
jgi:hypothetical protein